METNAFSNVPRELKKLKQFVCWRLEPKPGQDKKAKIPYNPKTGRKASTTNPKTWGTFEEALDAYKKGGYSGIGFVFTENDPYIGVDFDHIINGEDLDETVAGIVQRLNTYTEFSQSGRGLHLILKGDLPPGRRKNTKFNFEVYDCGRYFVMTAKPVPNSPSVIAEAGLEFQRFFQEYFSEQPVVNKPPVNENNPKQQDDEKLLKIMRESKKGADIQQLLQGDASKYGNDLSSRDQALCNHLAFFTKKDPLQIDRIFRTTGCFRGKWDEKRGAQTYGEITIETAIKNCKSVFNPTIENIEPVIISDSDLMSLKLPDPVWIIPNLLTEGLAILAGKPKLGKSWLALTMAISSSSGGYALGRIKVDKFAVLYLALEDTQRRMQSRLQQLNATPNNNLFIAFHWRKGNEGLLDIEAWLKKNPAVKLVIIDTLARFREVTRNDRNLYQTDYDTIGAIKNLADRYRIAILLIHHVRKGASDDPLEMVSGTTGISGSADTILVLSRQRGQADAVLFGTGRDIDEFELALQKDNNSGWTILGDAAEYRQSQERKQILDLLVKNREGLSPKEITEITGKCSNSIRAILHRMECDGLITKLSRGRYISNKVTS